MMLPVSHILETVLYVSDLDAAERFYGGVLGLDLESRKDGVFLFYRVGPGMLLLFLPEASRHNTDIPAHGADGAGHMCLAVAESALPDWMRHLVGRGISIEHIQHWPRGARSVYVRDPAGNSIELATPRIWGLADVTD
jgi:catechol 2,3-dioxygenase-like lactoylglutathione lyase family enzyme